LRILHLVDRLAGRGGAYTHLAAVAAAQAEAGHDVTIAGGPPADAAAWPCAVRAVPGLEARTRLPVELDGLHRDIAPDLVHVHTVVNPRALEWAGSHRAVATVQDHRYFCPGRGRWTMRGERCTAVLSRDTCAGCFEDEPYFDEVWGLTRERLRALERLEVVVLSRYMRDELVAAGLAAERVHVVPPFVHGLDGVGPSEGEPCVLFVGRLTEAKGVRPAVEAWRRSGLGLPLVIAGTGPLREWARSEGAEVLGWVARESLRALYLRAVAVLMPPLWQEPFGIAGLEALSLGTPVAAWRSGGIPDWHPGDESLADWGDVEGLARALKWCGGRRASAPAGFDRGALMERLDEAYRRSGAARSVIFSTLR
jgi:glycosyltransferase involved in cell wall biosynthesis